MPAVHDRSRCATPCRRGSANGRGRHARVNDTNQPTPQHTTAHNTTHIPLARYFRVYKASLRTLERPFACRHWVPHSERLQQQRQPQPPHLPSSSSPTTRRAPPASAPYARDHGTTPASAPSCPLRPCHQCQRSRDRRLHTRARSGCLRAQPLRCAVCAPTRDAHRDDDFSAASPSTSLVMSTQSCIDGCFVISGTPVSRHRPSMWMDPTLAASRSMLDTRARVRSRSCAVRWRLNSPGSAGTAPARSQHMHGQRT